MKLFTTISRGLGEHYVAKVLYDFNTDRDEELSVQAGQTIKLAPKNLQPRVRGWLLAANEDREGLVRTGLVPANYIEILGRNDTKQNPPPDVVQIA